MSHNLLINEELVDLVSGKPTLDHYIYNGRSDEESEGRIDKRGGKNNPGHRVVNYMAESGMIYPLIIMGQGTDFDKPENFTDFDEDEEIQNTYKEEDHLSVGDLNGANSFYPSEKRDKKKGRWVDEARQPTNFSKDFKKRADTINKKMRPVVALLYNEDGCRIWLRSGYNLISFDKMKNVRDENELQLLLRHNLDDKFINILDTFNKNNPDDITNLILNVTGKNDIENPSKFGQTRKTRYDSEMQMFDPSKPMDEESAKKLLNNTLSEKGIHSAIIDTFDYQYDSNKKKFTYFNRREYNK